MEITTKNVNTFCFAFAKELQGWLSKNGLEFAEPIEWHPYPNDEKYQDNAFIFKGCVQHGLLLQKVDFAFDIGPRFNVKLPETYEELMKIVQETTDALTKAFGRGDKK